MTSGELITSVIRVHLNQGGRDAFNPDVRARAEFHLQALSNKAWGKAPWHWKRTTANVTLPADGLGTFSLPSNYIGIGTRGALYITGQRFEIQYRPADVIARNRQLNSGTATRPCMWGLAGQSAIGIKQGKVWKINSGALTLILENYDRTPPVIVDRPVAPTVTSSIGGALGSGVYRYRVTYVTAEGETEGGDIASITLDTNTAGHIVSIVVPVSNNSKVTSRKVYRSIADGTDTLLLATVSGNQATTITDEALDNTLGAAVPLSDTAVTGLELFPSGYHESVFYDGLKARLMGGQGDLREAQADAAFMDGIKDMWINSKEDRARIPRMARYGATAYRQ